MLQDIWDSIQNTQLAEARQKINTLNIEDEYLNKIANLLLAYIALEEQDFDTSIELARSTQAFCEQKKYKIDDLSQDPSGLGLKFLEPCFFHWIMAKSQAGLLHWNDAEYEAQRALDEWENYQISRKPFIIFDLEGCILNDFPQYAKPFIKIVRSLLKKKLTKKEMLDLLVPDNFQPKSFSPRTNGLQNNQPFVSVCICSYCDEQWLQKTIEAVFSNAGYENYEVVLIYQKKSPEDPVDSFLRSNPYSRLKNFIYDTPLGAEKAKEVSYEKSSGEIIISLDGHIIPCHNFIKKTVQVFYDHPEVSILNYGLLATFDDESIDHYYFNEIPYDWNGIIGHMPISHPQSMLFYKPGLYIRQCVMGAAFCMTRKLFNEVGGYLLKNYSWGDKSLGMNAYLYGYQIFTCPELICIHKWHQSSTNAWTDTVRRTKHFEYEIEVPVSSLIIGYVYFSKKYFEEYFIPWIKDLSGSSFDFHWKKFLEQLPQAEDYKTQLWKNAVRSVREYWLEYGEYIIQHLAENEKNFLFRNIEKE